MCKMTCHSLLKCAPDFFQDKRWLGPAGCFSFPFTNFAHWRTSSDDRDIHYLSHWVSVISANNHKLVGFKQQNFFPLSLMVPECRSLSSVSLNWDKSDRQEVWFFPSFRGRLLRLMSFGWWLALFCCGHLTPIFISMLTWNFSFLLSISNCPVRTLVISSLTHT